MDNANWISFSLPKTEDILKMADEFYIMTKSAINKNKTKVLTTKRTDGYVNLKFGSTRIIIHIEQSSIRFLAIWIHPNLLKSRSFVTNQIRDIVKLFGRKVKYKKITDNQLTYVHNTVLIPTLTYLAQITPFTEKHCLTLTSSISTLIKHRLSLSNLTNSTILYHKSFYNLTDLHCRLLQDYALLILNSANSEQSCSLLYNTFKLRLFQLQSALHMPSSPLVSWKIDKPNGFLNNNLIGCVLSIMKKSCPKVNYIVPDSLFNNIKGSSTPIVDIIGHDYMCDLAKRSHLRYNYKANKLQTLQYLLFSEQLTYSDGKSMMTWQQFCLKWKTLSATIPKLFVVFQEKIISDSSTRAIFPQHYGLPYCPTVSKAKTLDEVAARSKHMKLEGKIVAGKSTTETNIIGKALDQSYINNIPAIQMQHLTKANPNTLLSASMNQRTILPCPGCPLNITLNKRK